MQHWKLLVACLAALILLDVPVASALAPEEEAQSFLRQAVVALDQDNVEPALKLLDKCADAGALVRDASWRDAILEGANQATIAVLMAAGAAKWDQGSFDQAFRLYQRAVDRGRLGLLTDEVRRTAAKALHLHMLQLWLAGDEVQARTVAGLARTAAAAAWSGQSAEHKALDELSSRIARPRSLEVLVRSEIERTKRAMEADAPRFPDPRQPWRIGLLAHTLRAFDLATTLFERAMAAAEGGTSTLDSAILIGAREKLEHARALVRKLVVRSNVPFYTVEVWRPDAALPEGSAEADDATAGVSFTVHPGRYIIKVFNAEYGTCERDDIAVESTDAVAVCRFTAPPVAVTLDTQPRGMEARVSPSDQIDWRAVPFALNLMRGRYTLSVKHPKFREPIDVPFVVTREGRQEFDLDLSRGSLELAIPPANQGARVRVDGKDIPRALGNSIDVDAGAHTVEVFQSGFQTWRQAVVVRPLDRTLVKPEFIAGVGDDEVAPPPRRSALVTAGYMARLHDVELTGYDRNGTLNTVSRSYPVHHARVQGRWFPVEDEDPYAPRWLVLVGADVGLASGNPVDDMLLTVVAAGGGVQLLSRGGEWVTLEGSWRIGIDRWKSAWNEGAFTMNALRPLGVGLGARSRVGWLAATADVGFSWGTGQKRQSTSVPGLPTGDVDLTLMGLDAALFVGLDLVDMVKPDDDLDVVFGATGFMSWYSEKRSDKPSAFQALDGGAGARIELSWRIRGAVDTRIFADAELRFIGDFAPELAPVFDEKQALDAVPGAGNLSAGAGVEVGF